MLKCVSIIIFFGLNHWNIFAQNDLNRFDLHEKHKGVYASHVTFYWKPFGEKDTSTYHYQYFQQINDSLITNDKAVVYTLWNDTLYMMNVQIGDSIFCLRNTHYDTFSIANSNYGNFLTFLSNNLRSFHDFSGKQDFPLSSMSDTTYDVLDGTEIPIVSYSNAKRKDSAGRFGGKREIMDIMSGDTLYQAWEISGMKISNDSFNRVFGLSLKEIREINSKGLKPLPEQEAPADSLMPSLILTDDWLERIDSHNISGIPIGHLSNGKKKVFYFYYNGCVPCMMAKPYIRKALQNEDFEVIAVNGIDKDLPEIIQKLKRDSLVNISVIKASKELMAEFKVRPHPTVLIFDSEGNQLYREEGYSEKMYKEMFGE